MNLNELAQAVHKNAVEHGWWEEPRNFGEVIALCHSELSEALEEFRNGRSNFYNTCTHPQYKEHSTLCTVNPRHCLYSKANQLGCCAYAKPEGIATELADCIIRILDYCGYAGIDIAEVIRVKHEYNKTRPYKHGGKKI